MLAMLRVIAILVLVTTLGTGSAASPSAGVAFDQIDKVTLGPAPAEASLDTFAKDRLSLLTAAQTSLYPPAYADSTQQALQNFDFRKIMKGTLRRYAYLGQWTRVDDPIKSTATITRPDLHEVVYLDLGKKTYRVDSATLAAPNDSLPQLAKIFKGTNSKTPGRAVMTTTNSRSALPPRQYEGLDLQGTTNTSSTVIDHATGSCHASDITFTIITFTAKSIADPKPAQGPLARKLPLSLRDILGGCRLKRVQTSAVALTTKPEGFYVYRRVETQTKFNGTTTPKMTFVSQRGNIKLLTENDKGLFQAPADFSKIP